MGDFKSRPDKSAPKNPTPPGVRTPFAGESSSSNAQPSGEDDATRFDATIADLSPNPSSKPSPNPSPSSRPSPIPTPNPGSNPMSDPDATLADHNTPVTPASFSRRTPAPTPP